MKLKVLFQVYSCYVILTLFSETCASVTSNKGKDRRATLIDSRNALLIELVEDPLKEFSNHKDINQTEHLSNRLQSTWEKIVEVSSKIFHLTNRNKQSKEKKYQMDLKQYVSYHLFFIAKIRHCVSPYETFYKPMNQCLRIGSTKECPENMSLNDGPDNEGFCDCKSSDPNLLFFSQTGRCYRQNTQGPCQDREWILIQDGTPQCQTVPEGCPADGKHVYWSPNEILEKKCWKLGTQGPCPIDDILLSSGSLDVFCINPIDSQVHRASIPHAPLRKKTEECNPGSYRKQHLQCNPSFF